MHHLLFPLHLRLRPRAGSLLSSGSLFVQNRRAPTSLEGERAKRGGFLPISLWTLRPQQLWTTYDRVLSRTREALFMLSRCSARAAIGLRARRVRTS
jgi:hypothetical protein